MARFTLAFRALQDVRAIREYIEKDNPPAAIEWLRHLEDQCQLLGDMPKLGAEHPEFGCDIRMWRIGDYLIFYRPGPDGVRIVRVLHGRRDIRRILGRRS